MTQPPQDPRSLPAPPPPPAGIPPIPGRQPAPTQAYPQVPGGHPPTQAYPQSPGPAYPPVPGQPGPAAYGAPGSASTAYGPPQPPTKSRTGLILGLALGGLVLLLLGGFLLVALFSASAKDDPLIEPTTAAPSVAPLTPGPQTTPSPTTDLTGTTVPLTTNFVYPGDLFWDVLVPASPWTIDTLDEGGYFRFKNPDGSTFMTYQGAPVGVDPSLNDAAATESQIDAYLTGLRSQFSDAKKIAELSVNVPTNRGERVEFDGADLTYTQPDGTPYTSRVVGRVTSHNMVLVVYSAPTSLFSESTWTELTSGTELAVRDS